MLKPKLLLFSSLLLLSALTLANAEGDADEIEKECGYISFDEYKVGCPVMHTCINYKCEHDGPWPTTWRPIVASFFIMLFARFATLGAARSGSIYTPLLIVLYNYPPVKTVMLIHVLLFGTTMGNFLNVFRLKDPKTGKLIMRHDIGMMVYPCMMIGTYTGGLLHRVFPQMATLMLLLMVTTYMFVRVVRLGRALNNKALKFSNEPLIGPNSGLSKTDQMTLMMFQDPGLQIPGLTDDPNDVTKGLIRPEDREPVREDPSKHPHELASIIQQEMTAFPYKRIGFNMLLLLFLTLMLTARGTNRFPSIFGYPYCELAHWIIYVLGVVGCIVFFILGETTVVKITNIKKRYNYNDGVYDITYANTRNLGLLGVAAGLLAAFAGVGAGPILGSTMIKLGLNPPSVPPTAALFAINNSFVLLFQAYMFGEITNEEMIYFFIISTVGSFSVTYGLRMLIIWMKKPFMVFTFMALVLLTSILIIPPWILYTSLENVEAMIQWNPICPR